MAIGTWVDYSWVDYSVSAISDWEIELPDTKNEVEVEHDETILNWLEGR